MSDPDKIARELVRDAWTDPFEIAWPKIAAALVRASEAEIAAAEKGEA